ncbi:hypothetical protein VdG1_02918 [Verticillium dahliae VDG1]|nr:hypothetical protein VdG1_02918 [Verticillium dahliae VDG1]
MSSHPQREAKIGHGLAKVLGIKLQENEPQEEMLRGESVISTQSFVEEQPTSAEWLAELVPDAEFCRKYVKSLFPFVNWIGYYNVGWLIGDLVAGITVGAVVVPQGMAYALLANLDPEFGLYSSFMGVLIYWFFATSKDITIGPVAVLSTVVGNIISRTRNEFPQYAPHEIASALAVISGAIVLFIGLIRMGWIVNVISLTSLSAFMTGSAISIAVGQTPTMMGIKGFSTREATYKVFINTLKGLGRTKMDAAMGLSALTMLYAIRSACSYAAKRWPARQRLFFFLSTLRTAFVILLYTMISWLVNMNRRQHPLFKILGNVPRGFQDVGVPRMDQGLISAFASELPATVIVLVIEHIAISKSFGRVNNYQIDPSQDRTAIKSKAGVKTPFAGVITGLVVLLAIYALTANGIYATVAISAAMLFWRILRGRGRILGKVKIHSVIGDHVIGEDPRQIVGEYGTFDPQDNAARNVFLPVDHGDGSNPEVELDNPYPGIFIYRFSEGFNYPNAAHSLETNVHVGAKRRGVVVHGLNRPLFHVDLTSAMQSAIANVEAREEHVQAQIQDKVQDSSATQ